MTTVNKFPRLLQTISNENEKRHLDFCAHLDKCETTADILGVWHYRGLLPAGKKNKQWEPAELKQYLKGRHKKQQEKRTAESEKKLLKLSDAPELEEITISVEWKNNRTWGANPTAEARVKTVNPDESGSRWHVYASGSIGGCGYDKKSTAVAKAVNQSPAFIAALCAIKEQSPEGSNRDVFSYGAGYGIIPQLEGGVGVSCYPDIFCKIGYKFEEIASGKNFDVFKVSKIK
jgi:hypothetical protein